jgi:hypothetical protein
MRKIKGMIDLAMLRFMMMLESFKEEERGDTNFLSIAIILVVVLALAIVFITFGQDLTDGLEDAIEDLKDALGI